MSDPYSENHHEKLSSHNLLSIFMLYLILGISFMFIFIVKDDKDPVRHCALKVKTFTFSVISRGSQT